jgi:hypothetical protein
MQKVLWVVSSTKSVGAASNDGLETVNEYLEKGWEVKHITAAPMGNLPVGQAYVVLEK